MSEVPPSDRPVRSKKPHQWGRSVGLSSFVHGTLISLGFAFPLAWLATNDDRPPRVLRADFRPTAAPEPPLDPEPEREVETMASTLEDVELLEFETPPAPLPEPEAREPLEAVELLAEALRRPPLRPLVPGPEPEPEPDPVVEPTPPEPPIEVAEAEIVDEPATEPVLAEAEALAAHCPKPPYPRRAQRMGWQGTVVCRLLVGPDGLVQSVEVVESTGYELLDRTVVDTLATWRFAPATTDGVPRESEVLHRFRFQLNS